MREHFGSLWIHAGFFLIIASIGVLFVGN